MIKVFAFITVALLALMAAFEVAPFGGNTLTTVDASIQYLDFFAYWQKVLLDGASMTFSFDKGLGGNLWAVMTYYLFSPLNFLVIFFSQENLQSFYNLLVVIKLGLCGATMAYYLQKRFEGKLSESAVFVLSVGYGLMNYNLQQAKNAMWLDGAYMLPLMLLGLYRFRREGRWSLLVLSSALCILFNWYMGLIDAVFVGLFSLVEYFIPEEKFSLRKLLCFELKVACAMLLALGLNGWQFIPTLEALSSGRGSIDWQNLTLQYWGNPLSIIQGLTWGAVEKERKAAFFAGDLATFGTIAFFLQKNISRRLVWIGYSLLAFIFLMFYWQPFIFLFSLLKDVVSYWYRYAHLASFILIFLASLFVLKRRESAGWKCKSKYGCILMFSLYPLILIGRQYKHPLYEVEGVIGAIILYVILVCYFTFQEKISPVLDKKCKKIIVVLLLGGIIGNVVMTCQFANNIVATDFSARQSYTGDSIKRTADFKKLLDSETYRTSQSRFYSQGSKAYLTANYNEGLAYGYHSLATYTSSPVNAQLYLYDHLGYKKNGDNFNVLNVSLLPADSLLGVNYVFADRPVEGLQPIMQVTASEDIKQYENTVVYSNHFALPLAFVCQDFELSRIEYRDNPFSYTNEVYSRLFGEKIDVYREVPYQIRKETDNELVCEVGRSSADAALYGNLKKGAKANLISVNGEEMYYHSVWLGNSVFYVPQPVGREASEIRFQFRDGGRQDAQPYFYQTDPAALQQAHDKAADRAAVFEKFSDHELVFTVEAREGEKLFTSLPYDKGWQIMLNGHEVEPVKICEALIGLQLEAGANRVEMHYSLPGAQKGLVVTVVSFFLLLLLCQGRIKFVNK